MVARGKRGGTLPRGEKRLPSLPKSTCLPLSSGGPEKKGGERGVPGEKEQPRQHEFPLISNVALEGGEKRGLVRRGLLASVDSNDSPHKTLQWPSFFTFQGPDKREEKGEEKRSLGGGG